MPSVEERLRYWRERATTAEADIERLRAALAAAETAIAEFYRYQYGGDARGSYDGKPEREGLWKAWRQVQAALASGDALPAVRP